jgi:hypothetical protein
VTRVSTSFDIYPVLRTELTYAEVRDRTLFRFNEFVARHGVTWTVKAIRIVTPDRSQSPPEVDYADVWAPGPDRAIWFLTDVGFVGWVIAGCDVMDAEFAPFDEWMDTVDSADSADAVDATTPAKARTADRYYRTYRSMGAPAFSSVGYGVVAAVFAELTDGYLWSIDSAAPFPAGPRKADEFLASWTTSAGDPENTDYWAKTWDRLRGPQSSV